jgi:uncharacterized protein YvpB
VKRAWRTAVATAVLTLVPLAPLLAVTPASAGATTPPLVVRGRDSGVWVRGGGLVGAPPTAVVAPGGGFVLYIGTGNDHDVWASAGDGGWQRLSSSQVNCVQGVAATVASGMLHVACEGVDRAFWTASAPFAAGSIPLLSNWHSLGGTLVSAPALLTVGGQPDYLAPGVDSRLWEAVAGDWQPIGMQCYGHPLASAAGTLGVAACRGLDNSLYYVTRSGAGAWSSVHAAGGSLTEVLAVRPVPSAVLVDVAAPDGSVWETTASPSGSNGWQGFGGQVLVTAEAPFVNGGIPLYDQTMPLDCEAASEQMALAYYGHGYSQTDLFNAQNPDTRRSYRDSSGTLHWGDPYTNFVGNVNGSEGNLTGYGVYFPPIVDIAHSHGMPNATGGQGYRPLDVYNAVAAGHPVEAWTEYHWVRPGMGTWLAFDGRTITYSTYEHAVVLTGISDSSVRINDPTAGSPYWVSRANFEASWHDFGNMAVIFA